MPEKGRGSPFFKCWKHSLFLLEGKTLPLHYFGAISMLKVWRLLLPFVVCVALNLPTYLVVRYFLFLLVEGALRLFSCNEGGVFTFFLRSECASYLILRIGLGLRGVLRRRGHTNSAPSSLETPDSQPSSPQ